MFLAFIVSIAYIVLIDPMRHSALHIGPYGVIELVGVILNLIYMVSANVATLCVESS
jgi:hypothetical protein